MTDEEIEDMNFKQYLEARYYEALFADLDKALFMGEEDNEVQT
jgi:hypothetical protein